MIRQVQQSNGDANGLSTRVPALPGIPARRNRQCHSPYRRKRSVARDLTGGSSRQIYTELRGQIRSAACLAAVADWCMAVLLSSWAAARVTRPVEELAQAAREVAAGNWNAQVQLHFARRNRPARGLLQSNDARSARAARAPGADRTRGRLAGTGAPPSARAQEPAVSAATHRRKSACARASRASNIRRNFSGEPSTLLAEIANLKTIVGRFSDFSKMPQPQFQAVD